MSIIYEPRGRAREYAPLAANLYSGCAHGCKYCYAPAALRRTKESFHDNPSQRKNILAELFKDCFKLAGKETPPILLSFTTDAYQPLEEKTLLTRRALEVMKQFDLNVEILTKGGMRAARDFDLLGAGDAFATTLTFIDPQKSLEWEPFAALPQDRMKAMQIAHERGIKTWASLEPVIEPEESLELIRQTAGFVDLFKIGKLNYHAKAKETDWEKFTHDAVNLLEKLGAKYYIKKDLQMYL